MNLNIKNVVILSLIVLITNACKQDRNEIKKPTTKANIAIEKISKLTKKNILVCAHRSYHRSSPENSIQSLKDAIEANIDIVEIDIRTTKDSILILMHDKTIDRTTTGTGTVTDYTFEELQQFNLKIGDSVTNQKIPLVKEVLEILKGKLIPNLDLKAVDYQQLYALLKELEMEHEVLSFIGNKEKIQEMIRIDSLYAVMPLTNTFKEMNYYYKNTVSPLQHFTAESFTTAFMKWIKERGELVFVNTLWDQDEDFVKGNNQSMDSVISLRPAIIQTDYPKLLITYLKNQGLHE